MLHCILMCDEGMAQRVAGLDFISSLGAMFPSVFVSMLTYWAEPSSWKANMNSVLLMFADAM